MVEGIEKLNQIVWHTELSLYGKMSASKPQWAMWLNLMDGKQRVSLKKETSSLRFEPVGAVEQWDTLERLRAEIEVPFGVTEPVQIHSLVKGIRRIVQDHKADWFLVYSGPELVGEVGLVEFETDLGKVGRLQDVDILPIHQGRGFGSQLLIGICDLARNKGMHALCLKADVDRWVKDWYLRFGFEHVGTWNTGNGAINELKKSDR